MIQRDFACSPQDYEMRSPWPVIGMNRKDDWRPLLSLFDATEVVWIGRTVKDSAGAESSDEWLASCKRRFRPVSEWLQEQSAPGLLTCPSSFTPGVSSRSTENIALRRYLVVESDTLSKCQVCAVFKWLEQFMKLRAIIDTAGKSLHGWFEMPLPSILEELKVILPALGCDPAMFTPAQPCRLPRGVRDGQFQCLVYLDGKVAHES